MRQCSSSTRDRREAYGVRPACRRFSGATAAASCTHSIRFARYFARLLSCATVLFFAAAALAQVPQEARSAENFSKVFYRNTPAGRIPSFVCSGKEATPLDGSKIETK